ncbi:MAG: N-carbamoylputrescine amidase [Bacteriovoracaceae bacterium]|nr:N-carbamoylputrescine amidase [Bacteriovoracaceae bacterium]
MEEIKKVSVSALQTSFTADLKRNIEKVSDLVRKAAGKGAQIILPSELFEGLYFCQNERDEFFAQAKSLKEHPAVSSMQELAKSLKVVIPASFFEKEGPHYYNSVAIIDADGSILGTYRKSHIPDGPGYEEKFYFRPGNTGFKVWKTRYGTIGVGICWDQWFPECARAMMLMGADLLFYPTAIGSEPQDPTVDTKDPWQRAMIGHSVSNSVPVIAANRIGKEGEQTFYGSSFITDHRGEKLAELGRNEEGIVTATLDLEKIRLDRASFGFFRDRRPELYKILSDSSAE